MRLVIFDKIAAINGTFFNAYDQNDLQPMDSIINKELLHRRGDSTAMGIFDANELGFASNTEVKIHIELPDNLNSSKHMISVGPKLITEGKIVIDFEGERIKDPKLTTQRGQRSFIGMKSDQTIVMVQLTM